MPNLEICKFKNYQINTKKNDEIFLVLNDFVKILLSNNIDFLLTGSLALILNTQKIYRTIGDIDLVLKNPLNKDQTNLLSKYDYRFGYSKIGIDTFCKNEINIEFHYFLLDYNYLLNSCKKINYNNNLIKSVSVKDVLECKKLQSYKFGIKKKDIDDTEFYSFYV